jgi:hypothetical protein
MTHIEQAIKEAVENGYADHAYCNEFDKYESSGSYCYSTVFLDPLFWQALGKARGWRQDVVEQDVQLLDNKASILVNWGWKLRWHRFIDHLAEGKDAEIFFAMLDSE